MSRPTYGGQAVVEGVMIRGPRAMAVAVRRPDGEIVTQTERLGGLYTNALRRVPLARGIFVLWETLALGIRALSWSSSMAADEVDEFGKAAPLGLSGWAGIIASMSLGIAIFFVGPVAITSWLDRWIAVQLVVLLEGAIRMAMLVGYIWLIGQSDDIQRVFQYHGAEHMTIHAFERGLELRVPAIRRFAKEHPRCGTSFLLTVTLVAVVVFVLIPGEPLWWRYASRLLLMPVIAALAYEVIRFAGFHADLPVVRWIFAGNLALQKLTTKDPEDEQIQVAVAALDAVRAEEERVLAS